MTDRSKLPSLPWRFRDIKDREDDTRIGRQSIVDASGTEIIADVDEDDRRLIIKAVNAHDGLVEVLELVKGSLQFDRSDPVSIEVMRRIDAVLKLAA